MQKRCSLQALIAASVLPSLASSPRNNIDGDHLICILSEGAPEDYLSMLPDKGISYIVAGKSEMISAHQ